MLCVLRLGCNCFECVGKSALAVCSLAGRFCASYSLAGCFVSRMFIGWTFLCCLHERQSYAIKTLYWTVPHPTLRPPPLCPRGWGPGVNRGSGYAFRVKLYFCFFIYAFWTGEVGKYHHVLTTTVHKQSDKNICATKVWWVSWWRVGWVCDQRWGITRRHSMLCPQASDDHPSVTCSIQHQVQLWCLFPCQ